tara:strand:- start:585 stop:1610 length:1026 start_codon:yes stop_codon:yes gene_type:complete
MSNDETEVDLSEWSEIDTSGSSEASPKVEFEIEEEVTEKPNKVKTVQKEKVQEVLEEEPTQEQPEELEGIKTKGAEKRIKQLIRQRKEREEEIEKLRNEVQNLRGSVKTREKELATSLKTNIDSNQGQITSRIEQAREIFKQAADSGDTDRMLAAQEEMSKAYAESMVIKQQQQAWEEYNARLEAAGQTVERHVPQQQQEYDPKAVAWASKNPWFGQDQIMTSAALAADAELKSEGYDPADDDFYEEIDQRLRSQFPHKYEKPTPVEKREEATPRLQDTPSNSAQVVAGASRTPQTTKGNKVKLSQEDVQRANKWGIPLEQYAAEKLKAEQADGEYTEIYN